MIKMLKIKKLKLQLRREYSDLVDMVDSRGADCGLTLLAFISPACSRQASRVVAILDELRTIDPEAPKTPQWVLTLAS